MEISILHMPVSSSRWNLVYDYMRLRREVFMDRKRWDLRSDGGIEFEQYDILGHAYYVLAHDGDDVLAGCRLIRCSSKVGPYTYMIKDAYDGLISLPPEICDSEPPTSSNCWEMTRLVSVGRDRRLGLRVMVATNEFLISMNAAKCLCLSSPAAQRLATILGFTNSPLGPVCSDASGEFLAFEIDLSVLSNKPKLQRLLS